MGVNVVEAEVVIDLDKKESDAGSVVEETVAADGVAETASKEDGLITEDMIKSDPRVIAAINRGVNTARSNLEVSIKAEYEDKLKQYEEIQNGESAKLVEQLEKQVNDLNDKLSGINTGLEPVIEKIKGSIHESLLDLVDDMISDNPVSTVDRLLKLQAKSLTIGKVEPVGTGGSNLNAKPRINSDEMPSLDQWKAMSPADRNNLSMDVRTKMFNKYGLEALSFNK